MGAARGTICEKTSQNYNLGPPSRCAPNRCPCRCRMSLRWRWFSPRSFLPTTHPTYYGDSKWCSASGCTNSQLSSSSGGSCAYGSLARDEVLPMRYFFVYVGSGLIRLKCCISPRSPARPTGSVYSGTLSGMRARLYLNSMVAFSAALSAAPRWNEPAWVGVSRGPGGGGGCPWASWRAAAHLLAP